MHRVQGRESDCVLAKNLYDEYDATGETTGSMVRESQEANDLPVVGEEGHLERPTTTY